jgi:hypothetical protein
MTDDLYPIQKRFGTKDPLEDGDLIDNRVLSQHSFIPIFERQGTNKRYYHVGTGIENADTNVGRLSADIQVADDDGGTNQANAKGVGRFAVYPDDPEKSEPKATGDHYTLSELRDWAALNTRDKPLLPLMAPGASKDEYVVFEVKIADSQNAMRTYAEGSTISADLTEVSVGQN